MDRAGARKLAVIFDSNVVADAHAGEKRAASLLGRELDADGFALTAVNVCELLGWPEASAEQLAEREAILSAAKVYPVDRAEGERAAELRRRFPALRVPDAIVAAVALLWDEELVTTDRDFRRLRVVPGLRLRKP